MTQELTTEQLIARGKEHFARQSYYAALEDLEAAAARAPHFADVQNLIGLCRSLLGRPEAALEAFARAVRTNPDYVEAHLNHAITLNDLGRTEEARAAFQLASEADAEKGGGRFSSALAARLANMHRDLGDLYAEGGDLAEAAAQFRRACEIRPQFVDIRNKLGRTLLDHGQVDEAERELRSILEINPSFVAARANLGLALYRAGRFDEAREEWERCRNQQPTNPQVESYLGMLQRQRQAESA